MKHSRVSLFIALVAAACASSAVDAQPLPQWLPIATLDKPFNDAAQDLERPHRFALSDCGNTNGHFRCTYASQSGIGMAAWASQSQGLVEQINIIIPRCTAERDLVDISDMLVHIFSPRRPYATFSRGIFSMSAFAAATGNGEYWLDDVSYQLIDRGAVGWGLVVRRKPWHGNPRSESTRRRVAATQWFYVPTGPCAAAPDVPPPVNVLRSKG